MKGRPPSRAIKEALGLAKLRGLVHQCVSDPERLYDITIVGVRPIAFIRVMYAPEIPAALSKILNDFRKEIRLLRLISPDATESLELWLRSKHGTWRLFRVVGDSIAEIDRDGKLLAAKPVPA